MTIFDCTVHCNEHDMDLARDIESSDEHTENGLCHGVGVAHQAAFPTHTLSYHHELVQDGDIWRLVATVAEEDANTRAVADELERLRLRAEQIQRERDDKATEHLRNLVRKERS